MVASHTYTTVQHGALGVSAKRISNGYAGTIEQADVRAMRDTLEVYAKFRELSFSPTYVLPHAGLSHVCTYDVFILSVLQQNSMHRL